MNGLIFKHLDKHVKALVTHEIQKDVMPLAHHEFLAFLEKNVFKNSRENKDESRTI